MSSKAPTGPGQFDSENAVQLLRALQEATRARPDGHEDVYVPPKGGEIAEADYHHFIFGQRGSGKSSLLRHLQRGAQGQSRSSVWIDQEIFSNLQYPDVLVSAVHELLRGVLSGVTPHAEKKVPATGWRRVLPARPRADAQKVVERLSDAANQMEKLKFAPLDRKVEWVIIEESTSKASTQGSLKMELVSIGGSEESGSKLSAQATEIIEGSKEQFLERALTIFRELLVDASRLTGGGFVFIDDLYQLRRSDQPLVLGYMHRLVKDTGLWLKVGSIRYSTVTFKPGDPPRGMQVGHDAHEVPLDRGLRHFQTTQQFLERILSGIAEKQNVDIYDLLTPEARKRLVLAAGGVARDYLRLTSGAISEARNRGVTAKSGSDRVTVEDVNRAAGLLSPSKFEDLKKDEPSEAAELESLVRNITEFCRSTKCAYFLIPTDAPELPGQVDKLQNLRFTHLLDQSETVPNEGARRFDVWFLDIAELSAQRATQDMDFLGWENREKRRNRRLIFTGEAPAIGARGGSRVAAAPRKAAAAPAQPAVTAGTIQGDQPLFDLEAPPNGAAN
jgi:energy-coupling factor transporter ATP-binding protein EcfA2